MPHHSDCPCRRAGTDTPVPARRAYRTRRAYRRHSRTPYAPEPGQGRTTPSLPYRRPGQDGAQEPTHLYQHDGRTAHDGRTGDIAVPPTRRGQGRAVPRPVCRTGGGERRAGTDQGVPARRAYRAPQAYRRHSRTSYAPGAGEPGSGDGNAEQSAPAARNVAIARRASATESGSSASYTTPHTTRRPRLACTNHRRRSAQGTTVTRQSRRSLTSHLPMPVSGRRAPGAPTPGPT